MMNANPVQVGAAPVAGARRLPLATCHWALFLSLVTRHSSLFLSLATCHGSLAATLRATRGLGVGRRLLDPGKRPERLEQLGLGPDLPVQLIEEDALHDFVELGTGRQTHRLKLGARQLGAHLREL